MISAFLSIDLTEEEKLVADLGKPKLGDKNTIRIRIRESKEFKVQKNYLSFLLLLYLIIVLLRKECRG